MPQSRTTRLVRIAAVILWLITSLLPACAEESLKVIANPDGGQVVYGPVDQSTPQGAMAAVLRYVHTHFGDRPQVGKVFKSGDGQIFGAFFTITAKTDGGLYQPKATIPAKNEEKNPGAEAC